MIEFNDLQTTVITITAVCATIMLLWNTVKVTKEMRRPSEERDRRLDNLEKNANSDDKRLKRLEAESRLTLKGQLIIIEQLTTPDSNPDLQGYKDEIYEYLIDGKGTDFT